MLYEMLTGGKPHAGESPAQVLYHALHDDVPPPSAAVPGLSYELDALVASATARSPELRPYDAVALLAQTLDARASLSAEQLDAVPPQAIAGGHDNADDRTSVIPRSLSVSRSVGTDPDRLNRTSRFASPPPPPRRDRASAAPRRGMWAVVVAVLLVLGVGGGVWYINSGQFTQVPAVLQQSEANATKRLEGAGLGVEVEEAFSDTVEHGRVISTDPAPGERIRDHDSVTITISKGPQTVKVPDLKGYRLDLAKTKLKDAGLEPGVVTREFSDEVVRGQVISTQPGSGTEISSGAAVRIVVSRGAPVEVPEVAGASAADATAELEEAGLKVKIAPKRVNSEFDKGLVAEQSPEAGKEAGTGDTVTLTLSKGPVMVEVPDVVGDSVDDATRRLKDAGFEVEEDRGILGLFGDEVKSQSVDGGDTAPKGSTITIEIR